MKRNNEEYKMYVAFWSAIRLASARYPALKLLHHVSNEGNRAIYVAKQVGILAGLPDYHLPVPMGGNCGLWLEIKRPGQKPTKTQCSVMDQLRSYGNFVAWSDNVQECVDIVLGYVGGKTNV